MRLNTIEIHKKDHTKIFFVFIILFAVIARVLALFLLESITHPATWEYEEIANNILTGKGLYYTHLGAVCRNTSMVLYSLICAVIYYFTKHSFLAVKAFQILLSIFNCILVYRVAKRLFDKRTGLFALMLISFHPGFIIYSVKLHPLILDALLFTLSVYFLLPLIEGKGMIKNSFLAGLAIGLALLTRSTIGLFVPVAIVFLLRIERMRKEVLLSLMAGIFLILSLLTIHNYLVFNKIVILPNDSGINFWTGNNPYSNGTANTLNGKGVLDSAPEDFLRRIKGMDEFGQKAFFYQESWNFIKNNPKRFIELFCKKLYYFWWFSPTEGLNYAKSWLVIYKLYYSIILALAILGLFFGIKTRPLDERRMIYMIVLFSATIAVAQALYYVDGRHRWSVEPFILIFSAYGIGLICSRMKI